MFTVVERRSGLVQRIELSFFPPTTCDHSCPPSAGFFMGGWIGPQRASRQPARLYYLESSRRNGRVFERIVPRLPEHTPPPSKSTASVPYARSRFPRTNRKCSHARDSGDLEGTRPPVDCPRGIGGLWITGRLFGLKPAEPRPSSPCGNSHFHIKQSSKAPS